MRKNERIIVFDPNTGGGIRQGSIYLYEYLKRYFSVMFFSAGNLSSDPILFRQIMNKVESFNPAMVIIHDTSRLEPFAYMKMMRPKIRLAYFSLCQNSYDDPNYISCFDYYLGPWDESFRMSSCFETKTKAVKWMFNLPKRFRSTTAFNKRSDIPLYVGRVMPDKFNIEFAKLIGNRGYRVDAYGEIATEDLDYYDYVTRLGTCKFFKHVPNAYIHEVYNRYKFSVMPSNDECFSLSCIEMAYCGGMPIIRRQCGMEYIWSNNLTFQPIENEDVFRSWEMLKNMPEGIQTQYVQEHSQQVRQRIQRWSDIECIREILSRPAPNRDYGDLYLIRDYLGETIYTGR